MLAGMKQRECRAPSDITALAAFAAVCEELHICLSRA